MNATSSAGESEDEEKGASNSHISQISSFLLSREHPESTVEAEIYSTNIVVEDEREDSPNSRLIGLWG